MAILPTIFPEGQSTHAPLDLAAQSRSAIPVMVANAFQSQPPPITLPESIDRSSAVFVVERDISKHWSNSDERRFSDLAKAKALDKATAEDLKQMNKLRLRRRTARNPMSGDEVIFHYKRRQMEAKLLKNLQEYVVFLQAPRGA